MIKTGLVSITFRQLSVEEIVKLVSKAGLEAIEWGGDVHVPHGNVERAKEVETLTANAGLEVAAYGSYYRVGCENEEVGSFEGVLETAVALGAPTIRVWAGNKGSKEADKKWWNTVIEESNRIATMAESKGIKIAYEYHDNTLTDTDESAIRLLKEVNHPNIYTYWQPPHSFTVKDREDSIRGVLPWLSNIHVFYWTDSPERVRHPISKAKYDWIKYLQIAAEDKEDNYAMIEFVKDDKIEQFLDDAEALKEIKSLV